MIARSNAIRHQVLDRVNLVQADLLPPCCIQFDLILANPPYVASDDLESAQPEVAVWEPRLALDGGADGLNLIQQIMARAVNFLAAGSTLLLEIGADQGPATLEMAENSLPWADIRLLKDYAGHVRVLVAQFPDNLPKIMPYARIAP